MTSGEGQASEDDNVKVVVRCRPLNDTEKKNKCAQVTKKSKTFTSIERRCAYMFDD